MAIREIITQGDERLNKKCHAVTEFNQRLWDLLEDMRDTLIQSQGVGLAAPQIGILRRVVVVVDAEDNMLELVNPAIIDSEGEQTGLEERIRELDNHSRYLRAQAAGQATQALQTAREKLAQVEERRMALEAQALPDADRTRQTLNTLDALLSQRERLVFLRRYWYSDPISDVAHRCRMSEGAVKVTLHRTRNKLRKLLEQKTQRA